MSLQKVCYLSGLKRRVGGELLKAEAGSQSSSQVTAAPGMSVKYIQEATVRKNGLGEGRDRTCEVR